MSRALLGPSPALILEKSVSFSVLTPRSTSPVAVCMYGVPNISLIWQLLQNSLNVLPVNAVAFSVIIDSGNRLN